jgi:protein gp37
MGANSQIQWTDATWNIARGCTKVDEDCKFCYMYRDSFDSHRYNPLEVVRTKTVFNFPDKYRATQSACWGGLPLIFTSSLTDWAHPAIDSYRGEVWDIIRRNLFFIYQMLTKRPERIPEILPPFWEQIRPFVWLGTSIGSQKSIQRLYDLVTPIQPGIKFLSLEPLHGAIDLPLNEFVDMGHKVKDLIDWVIVGGESGNESGKYRYRPCEIEWIENIVTQCQINEIPVFVKQLGTHLAKKMGLKDRHGGDMNEWPEHLRIRQFPAIQTTTV